MDRSRSPDDQQEGTGLRRLLAEIQAPSCEPFGSHSRCAYRLTRHEEHEVDPDPIQPPPGSFGSSSGSSGDTSGSCWRPQPTDGLDDHADTFACASPLKLGRPVTAKLENAWGDDEDVYRFTLDKTWRVRLGVVGQAGAGVGLYDVFGQRLEEAVGGSRLVRTLLPGRTSCASAVRVRGGYEVVAE